MEVFRFLILNVFIHEYSSSLPLNQYYNKCAKISIHFFILYQVYKRTFLYHPIMQSTISVLKITSIMHV